MKRHPPRPTPHSKRPLVSTGSREVLGANEQQAAREWRIEALVPGGEGMARLPDGRVGFAGGVAVGDLIRVEASDCRKGWVRASEWTLLAPGPSRVSPPCPWYGECGGCDWMHIDAAAQIQAKAKIVSEALRRIGGLRVDHPSVVESARWERYRRRLRLHIDSAGRIGLLARASHRVVEIQDCIVGRQELASELRALRDWGSSRERLVAEFESVELRASDCVPHIGLFWRPRSGSVSLEALAAVHSFGSLERAVAVAGHGVPASQRWSDTSELEIEVPLGSFVQVNAEVNGALTDALIALSQQHGVSVFVEFYCGSGSLTLPLLAHGLRGRAVELDSAAVGAARRTAQRLGLAAETFWCGDAGSASHVAGTEVDLVLLDPPRAGAARALQHVARLCPKHVALCACDPATLARDLRSLASQGYHLDQLTAFDMFPHTHHVEVLAWLTRRAR